MSAWHTCSTVSGALSAESCASSAAISAASGSLCKTPATQRAQHNARATLLPRRPRSRLRAPEGSRRPPRVPELAITRPTFQGSTLDYVNANFDARPASPVAYHHRRSESLAKVPPLAIPKPLIPNQLQGLPPLYASRTRLIGCERSVGVRRRYAAQGALGVVLDPELGAILPSGSALAEAVEALAAAARRRRCSSVLRWSVRAGGRMTGGADRASRSQPRSRGPLTGREAQLRRAKRNDGPLRHGVSHRQLLAKPKAQRHFSSRCSPRAATLASSWTSNSSAPRVMIQGRQGSRRQQWASRTKELRQQGRDQMIRKVGTKTLKDREKSVGGTGRNGPSIDVERLGTGKNRSHRSWDLAFGLQGSRPYLARSACGSRRRTSRRSPTNSD